MSKKFKIIVPKAGAANKLGTETKLYIFDEKVEAKESWQEDLMNVFVKNSWAIEIKDDEASDVGEAEPVRARNDKGHYIADDPNTPDVNEAYEGGKAPKKSKAKSSKKKS
tara:strand:+ start:1328 stop:1657 length:330 start_codon:yes stop_codon:yes gene_type:complete